jgi:hypothetical protein
MEIRKTEEIIKLVILGARGYGKTILDIGILPISLILLILFLLLGIMNFERNGSIN